MDKMYYKISEVSQMVGETYATLRFWENEFADRLQIHKVKGTRYYKDEDIETIKNIQYLLRKAGCTIEGAKTKLANDTHRVGTRRDISERLRAIRDELLAIRREINTTSFTDDIVID